MTAAMEVARAAAPSCCAVCCWYEATNDDYAPPIEREATDHIPGFHGGRSAVSAPHAIIVAGVLCRVMQSGRNRKKCIFELRAVL